MKLAGIAILCFGLLGLPARHMGFGASAHSPLPYDPGAYELAGEFRDQPLAPWTAEEAKKELLARVAFEKQRQEMQVYYYRIGYTISYPLALEKRPVLDDLPQAIANLKYPYLIWLAWNMDERWRLLHAAWRSHNDIEASALLQSEMAALDGWDQFAELNEQVGLVTGHFAGVMALALANPEGWDPANLALARKAAEALVDRDAWPWFQKQWKPKELGPRDVVNIPVIALVRVAQLARVIQSTHTEAYDARAREALETWCRMRISDHHTEGTAYDGFLMDSVTDWLDALPDRDAMLKQCHPAFDSLAECWLALTVPGRPDLHAPLGDVEPEMTFWVNALMNINRWQPNPESSWLLRRVQLKRMRAAALVRAATYSVGPEALPSRTAFQLPHAVAFRTGWSEEDALLVVGRSVGAMGHLHADSGSLILAWHGRCWITDPGYQQYRPGIEREFTLGAEAHNSPVIGDIVQTRRNAEIKSFSAGERRLVLDLTKCYIGLPSGAVVQREIHMPMDRNAVIIVRDTFNSLGPQTQVKTSWHGGTHLSWAFHKDWARLSDGSRVAWIGADSTPVVSAESLSRHQGSRGPLTLSCTNTIRGSGTNTWMIVRETGTPWKTPNPDAVLKSRLPK